MGYKTSSLLCFALLLAFSSATHGLDIAKMLSKYPEFNKFSQLLTETKLADQINSRKTITILALDDDAMSSLYGKSQNTIKAILSTHVLLDYFDEQRLMIAEGSDAQITTLFQTSGVAKDSQGFIHVALINEGEIAFASFVKDAPFNAKLVRTVATEPFTVSILKVNEPIIAPGLDASASSSSSSSPKSSSPSGASSSSPKSSPSGASPSSPKSSPSVVSAETPASVEGPAGAQTPENSSEVAPTPGSGSRTQMGLVGVVMALASSIFFSM